MHRILERQLKRLKLDRETTPDLETWQKLLEHVDRAYVEGDQDRYTLERALDISSTEMRQRFDELRAAQRQLVAASRKAGMADVATTVLHNVGNILNSVNVAAGVIAKLVGSKAGEVLGKTVALIEAQPQPGKFLDEDPKGKKVVPYLSAMNKALTEERASALEELAGLTKNVEHIKSIVAQQLSVARGEQSEGHDVRERLNLCELLEDAIGVVQGSLEANQDVVFVKDFESLSVHIDRHKVFQVLVNLLTNARDAVAGRSGIIRVETRRLPDNRAGIVVTDNGIGISPEALPRMFTQGFTTKAEGHGLGLHASACAAGELGGALTVTSEGSGKGASFTLTLPLQTGETSAPPSRAYKAMQEVAA